MNKPVRGVASYTTIGLTNWPLQIAGEEYAVRLELVGACAVTTKNFPALMSTASMFVMKDKRGCHPGAIFPELLDMYPGMSLTMSDLMFLPPFLWEDRPEVLVLGEKSIAWLQAIPISTSERKFAERVGTDALEDGFVEAQIDVFDISLPSVL